MVNVWDPNPPDQSTFIDPKFPFPDGPTGSITEILSLPISMPSAYSTTSTSLSVAIVPTFSTYAVTVVVAPGSGAVGLNSIPPPSRNGRTSAAAWEITRSPITMSSNASPSISARAGDDHMRVWTSTSSSHSNEIATLVPSSPSNAKIDLPYGIRISGSPVPSMSIQNGDETAISSFKFPLDDSSVRYHLCIGLD